jgi:predicted RecA/RadA family phage recombinase
MNLSLLKRSVAQCLLVSMLFSALAPLSLAQTRRKTNQPKKIQQPILASYPMPGQLSRNDIAAGARKYVQERLKQQHEPLMLEATPETFERYRKDLLDMLNMQVAAAAILNLPINVQAEQVKQFLSSLDYEKVSHSKQFPNFSPLKAVMAEQSSLMLAAIEQQKLNAATLRKPGGNDKRNSTSVANAAAAAFPAYQPNPACPGTPYPYAVLATAFAVFFVADGVREFAQDACKETVVVLGEGGNTSLVCIAVDVIWIAAKAVVEGLNLCSGDSDGILLEATYDRAEFIKDQIVDSVANDNANKAALSAQLTAAETHIVANDDAHFVAMTNQINVFQTLTVRMQVETNLASDYTTTAAVGLFQLPASRGGYLEVARQILLDTYAAQLAAAGAGVTVYNPSAELALGATYTSQGKYREAYYQYRRGYRNVVKYP